MASNEIKITSQDFYKTEDLIPDAVMESDDLARIKQLAGLTPNLNIGALQEYKGEGTVATAGSNISKTSMEKIDYQNNNNIQPGTPEWFKLWFSLPFMTGEKPW